MSTERLRQQVAACLDQALVNLDEMRQNEGRALTEEMQRLLASLRERTAQVQVLTERSHPAYALRLKARSTNC